VTGVTKSMDLVEYVEYDLLCLDGRGLWGTTDATVLTDELGVWIREGRVLLSVVVDARYILGLWAKAVCGDHGASGDFPYELAMV
jgi:hypothetical protein